MKPAMNCRGNILAKELFVDQKDLKNTGSIRINKNCDSTNRGKKRLFLRRLRAGTVLFALKMQ